MATADQKAAELAGDFDDKLAPGEVVIGLLEGLSEINEPMVSFPQNKAGGPVVAMSTLALTKEHVGREVALLFAGGDLNQPLIIGLIHSKLQDLIADFETTKEIQAVEPDKPNSIEATIDGKRVAIEGQDEVVLKCGESSITLTKSGRIMIRGRNILNRSTGLNRILGGSVQIN